MQRMLLGISTFVPSCTISGQKPVPDTGDCRRWNLGHWTICWGSLVGAVASVVVTKGQFWCRLTTGNITYPFASTDATRPLSSSCSFFFAVLVFCEVMVSCTMLILLPMHLLGWVYARLIYAISSELLLNAGAVICGVIQSQSLAAI